MARSHCGKTMIPPTIMTAALLTSLFACSPPTAADMTDREIGISTSKLGLSICGVFQARSGVTKDDVIQIASAIMQTGATATDAGKIVRLSVDGYCPEFAGQLQAMVAANINPPQQVPTQTFPRERETKVGGGLGKSRVA